MQNAAAPATPTPIQALLPGWLKAMTQRAQRLERDGWDINLLQLLHDDAATLARRCELADVGTLHERLLDVQMQLHSLVEAQALPLPPQSAQILKLLRALSSDAARVADAAAARPVVEEPVEVDENIGISLDATTTAELAAAFPRSAPSLVMNMTRAPDVQHGLFFDDSEFVSEQAAAAHTRNYRIFHLSDGERGAREMCALIEADGHMLSTFTSLESVFDALVLEVPPLMVIDGGLLAHIPTLLAAAQDGRKEPVLIRTVSFCQAADAQQQLAAIRADVTLPIVLPTSIGRVLQSIHAAMDEDDAARVLIIQDDNVQLLLTEDILGEAGMRPLTIANPFTALAALDAFRPDLILIDLHHAECDAIDVVRMLRARLDFVLVPVLFLAGDNDPGRRLRALAAGSDDYISGPISSRLLVAEVKARLHRARLLAHHFNH